jgi:hypothetical protein
VEYAFIKTPYYRLRPDMIELIAQTSRGLRAHARLEGEAARHLERLEWMNDGDSTWKVFDRHSLYGVKRVPRTLDNPLRRFIRQLPSSSVLPVNERSATS